MIDGSKTGSGIENGLTSITGEASNDGMLFSSSFKLFPAGTVDEYVEVVFRVRARRLLNQTYELKEKVIIKPESKSETYLNSIFFNI